MANSIYLHNSRHTSIFLEHTSSPSKNSHAAAHLDGLRHPQDRSRLYRSADTHLIPMDLPGYPGIDLYFKDDSSHPTGSLKHRLARSLFLYSLANGWLREGGPVIEASSGSTAVSEAYFARLLGLPFIAVMPSCTSPDKIRTIEFHGGRCHLVNDPAAIDDESEGSRARNRRPLPRSIHLRRTRHRLAREQQHRRIDFHADSAGAASGARMDRLQPRYRWHRRHAGPLRALSPPRHPRAMRRSRAFGVL